MSWGDGVKDEPPTTAPDSTSERPEAELDGPPTEEEVLEYARYLGMLRRPLFEALNLAMWGCRIDVPLVGAAGLQPDDPRDCQLVWVAEMAMAAPVPEEFQLQQDHLGRPFLTRRQVRSESYGFLRLCLLSLRS